MWAILPPPVRYDPDLAPNAKLLYAEIAAKTNILGYCWAKNRFFAEMLHLGEESVRQLVKALEQKGYITIDYDPRRANSDRRRIYLTAESLTGGLPFPPSAPPKNLGDGSPKKIGDPTLYENNKKENRPSKPKHMSLEIFQEICRWCGEDGELLLAWLQYADMRQKTHHPIATADTVKRACRKIDKAAGGRRAYAIGMLHKATDHSWTGLFPLKEGDEGFAETEPRERRPETWS